MVGSKQGRRFAGDVVLDFVEGGSRRPAWRRSWRWGSRWPSTPGPSCATRAGSSRRSTISPFSGLMANWTLDPPVSTPISRRQASAASRIIWYSRSDRRLGRSDGDAIAGVDAHRVEVLDGADDDAVVGEVAHDLELVLFPAEHALLNQHFMHGREVETAFEDLVEVFEGCRRCRPPVPPSVKLGRRIIGKPMTLENATPSSTVLDEARFRRGQADFAHRVLEQEAIFGLLDGFHFGADQLDAVLFEDARFGEVNGEVEAGLAADGGQQRVGTLLCGSPRRRNRHSAARCRSCPPGSDRS